MSEFGPKVAIIRPRTGILRDPLVSEPLTQEILAGVLLGSGMRNVDILDEMVMGETSPDILSKYNVVCISADTPSYPRAKKIHDVCREVESSGSGDIRTIIGGPHSSALPNEVFKDGWDVVCTREGDLIIAEIVQGNRTCIIQGQRVHKLDNIPLPARDLVDTKVYGRERNKGGKPTASILTSRGCPNSCIYCYKGVFGNMVYYRSIDNIMTELNDIKARGIDQIAIYDDTFTLQSERTIQLCNRMSDLGMQWTCNSRVNTINPSMLQAMKLAGCNKISFGLESADPSVLKSIQKGISLDQARRAVQMSKNAGIPSRLYLMFGFWEDSDTSVDATLTFLYETQPEEVQLALLVPLPGSQVYADALKYEIELPQDLEQYFYAGLGGPHSFITHTKHLNQEQYILAVQRFIKGIEEWKKQTKTT